MHVTTADGYEADYEWSHQRTDWAFLTVNLLDHPTWRKEFPGHPTHIWLPLSVWEYVMKDLQVPAVSQPDLVSGLQELDDRIRVAESWGEDVSVDSQYVLAMLRAIRKGFAD